MHDEDSPLGISDEGSETPIKAEGDTRRRMVDFSSAVELLGELAQAGLEDVDHSLQETVERLSKLADCVESSLSDFNDDDPDVVELVDFVIESCSSVRTAAMGEELADEQRSRFEFLRDEVDARLETQADDPFDDSSLGERSGSGDGEVAAPSQEEIAALLSGLGGSAIGDVDASSVEQPVGPLGVSESLDVKPESTASTGIMIGDSGVELPAVDAIEIDDELREAFLDDATRGLESMEQALLDLESRPGDEGAVTTIGRELHTIKGASASIGMSNLAAYIHEVEEVIRRTREAGQAVAPELLLPHVDVIQARVDGRQPEIQAQQGAQSVSNPAPRSNENVSVGPATQPAISSPVATAIVPASPAGTAAKRPVTTAAEGHSDDETVRVKASQLNRLMDMLSELVMLRNQRDTEISELKGIHDELIHSVTRIRMLSHEGEALLQAESMADSSLADDGVSFSHLNEVANDVLESAQRIRECYRPVAEGNQAVSQFIRNFRLELVQLRRMPVSGLFRRLHRAISDAARTEQKQVRVELIGEGTGIERSLQERIFEPLMHIVRNSVSHGIETPEQRKSAGKEPQGRVTLQAHSGPDLLVIEVRDDGRGLDYDAIRRRGIERGLIESDKSISRAELARLIFHPGFSTRESANQISGRGVGMDVVASTLERMRGWVEVSSENGLGSTIRLSLPLPSMIQHAMVFRSGGQLFALPAQSVRRTGEFDADRSPVDLNEVLGLSGKTTAEPNEVSRRALIEMAVGATTVDGDSGGDVSLMVDRVLGPEEVVVRPMPPMLKSHPLCIGATLSGMGEVVLLLDPRALAEAAQGASAVANPVKQLAPVRRSQLPKVLVVDDSKSARLRVTRTLEQYPVTVVQADDGQAAAELLAKERFAAVFSDIDMPRMSGLELLQSIKGDPRLESVPVIMISSRSIDTAGKHAKEIGAMDYIQKPLTAERLADAVSEFSWATS